MNCVQLAGHIGTIELRQPRNGSQVLTISLATTTRKKVLEEWTDIVEWHRVAVFGKRAEALSKFLNKGDPLALNGHLHTSKYTDRDGVERSSTEIIADDVTTFGARKA
jgi:single-strand DNA-binding protein